MLLLKTKWNLVCELISSTTRLKLPNLWNPSKYFLNSWKIPLKYLLSYQLTYSYPIDQQITRRSTILIAINWRCRIAKRQTTTSWFRCYKTICNQVVSSLPCLELFLQRWIRRGMRKKEKKNEDAATEGWKRDYGRIIGFASYGSLLEKVQAKLSPRHVAGTGSKSAANFHFNKPELPKSSAHPFPYLLLLLSLLLFPLALYFYCAPTFCIFDAIPT